MTVTGKAASTLGKFRTYIIAELFQRLSYIKMTRPLRFIYGDYSIQVGLRAITIIFIGISLTGFANAAQLSSRSIQLSNATPSATGTTYKVSVTPSSTTTIGGIAVDFCSDTPIIGSTTCAYPASFTMGSTPSVTVTSGIGVGGTWVTTNSEQGGASAGQTQTLLYTNTTAQSVTSGTPIIFTINNVTNPSTIGAFYARIVTFDTSANAIAQYTDGAANATTTRPAAYANKVDYGGIALSTATSVTVSAAVMETLTFCVSKGAPGNGCTGLTAPTLTIGHNSPPILNTSAVDTDTAYTQLSSNAASGVFVNLKVTSSTTCAGLSRNGGTTCDIPAKGSFGPIVAATANFGLNVADGTGGTGTVTHNGNYGTTGGSYGMGASTFTTYGDTIMSSSAPTANVNSLLTYGATASAVTPASSYSTTESLIAYGTF